MQPAETGGCQPLCRHRQSDHDGIVAQEHLMDGAADAEEWREVSGTGGKYRVSNRGRVSGPQGIMKGLISGDGYRRVNLRLPEGYKQKVLHKLVAESFIGPQPSGTEVQLVDGDKLNVTVSNIAYVPKGTGAARAVGNRPPSSERDERGDLVRPSRPYVPIGPGRPLRGDECGRARLTEADARDILLAYEHHSRRGSARKKSATLAEIAELYDVAKTTVFKLVKGENWRYLHLQLFGGLPDAGLDGQRSHKLAPPEAVEWAAARDRIIRQTRATVRQSGYVYQSTMKAKELRIEDLGTVLDELIAQQGYRCAQTGVRFRESSSDLRASLDRLDSNGHYEVRNLQLVTSWYNFAKGKRDDSEMRRMLGIHAGLFDGSGPWPPRLSGATEST